MVNSQVRYKRRSNLKLIKSRINRSSYKKSIKRSKRNKSKRKSRRKSRRKLTRKFGAKIILEDGTELEKNPNLNQPEQQEKLNIKYKKYLETVNKKLEKINQKIKQNHLVVSFGTFLFLLFILLYTSYDDIKNKSARDLMYGTYTYLVGGSILGQYALKDVFYKLLSDLKNAFTVDNEYKELCDNFEKLIEAGVVDNKMMTFYSNLKTDYIYTQSGINTTSKIGIYNIKSFIKLLHDLAVIHPNEMNAKIDDNYISNLITRLNNFIKGYGTAAKELEQQLINPLLLTLLGKDGPPISAIFLVGRPGVGKTRFVNHLAKEMDATIYEYNYKKDEQDEHIQTLSRSAKEQYYKLNIFSRMKLEDKEGKPIILFIEKLFNILLSLLGDPKLRTMEEPAMNINIKLPKKLLVICASNKSLVKIVEEDNKYEPLLRRFVEIFIPNISKEIQFQATVDYVKSIHPDMTIEDEQFIKDVVYKSNFPGMGELIVISNKYVQHLNALNVLKKYKEVEDIKEYRKNYLVTLEEKANKMALDILKSSPKSFIKEIDHDHDDE
jgi:hypothetical protein